MVTRKAAGVGLVVIVGMLGGAGGATATAPADLMTVAPHISSHGRVARHVWFTGGGYQDSSGRVAVDGTTGGPSYRPLALRRGDVVVVRTAREATRVELTLSAQPCRRRAAGRWVCRVTASIDGDHRAWLSIVYPSANAGWGFNVSHRPATRTATAREGLTFRLSRETGRIVGHLTIVGGPARHASQRAGGRVLLLLHGRQIAARRFGAERGFSLRVHPGTYRLVATSGSLRACHHSGPVRVSEGRRVVADIRCDIR